MRVFFLGLGLLVGCGKGFDSEDDFQVDTGTAEQDDGGASNGDATGGSDDGGGETGGSETGGGSSTGSDSGGESAGGSDGGSSTGGDDGGGGGTPSTPCPDGVICFDEFPASHSSNTATSSRDEFDSYACVPGTSEAGPEVLYRVTVREAGLLSLELTDMGSGADVDVHLLASESADDCISRGHWVAGAFVEPGEYWVVADSWTSSAGVENPGSYTLNMGLTTPADLTGMGIDSGLAEDALYAMGVAFENEDPDALIYAITDFSLRSSERRMWVVDLFDNALLWNIHVTHGENSSSSDAAYADVFSNINDSHQSSLGMMRGSEIFDSSFGNDGLKIDGVEDGYNDLVRPRAIVMHGAEYARPEFIADYGRAGESWGCPAVDDRIVDDVVGALSGGGMLFFWYPDGDWSLYSDYLR